jgi:hypothetical protein
MHRRANTVAREKSRFVKVGLQGGQTLISDEPVNGAIGRLANAFSRAVASAERSPRT